MHYAERIQPVVAERLKVLASAGVAVTAAERLEVVKTATRDVFEDESEEVKAEIAKKVVAAQKVAIKDDDQEGRVRTPQEYQE